MRSRGFSAIILLLVVAIFVSILPGCGMAGGEKVTSYLAVAPLVLQSRSREVVSVTLLSGETPVRGEVGLALLKGSETVLRVREVISGKGKIEFDVPELPDSEYTLSLKGDGFQDEGVVKVARDPVIFLETDKPIYKPGQSILIRVITLNSELRPLSEAVTVEALDAKGIKIFRKAVNTDDYGMTSLELPVSEEPNLGVWEAYR